MVPGLNESSFEDKYAPGNKLAPKVFQVKHKVSHIVYVAYRIAKEAIPCEDPDTITTLCKTLLNLDHPNVCRLFEAFDNKWCLYLIYEQVRGKPLFSQLKADGNITERIAAGIVQQISHALNNAFDFGIVHGALCPKNLLLNNNGMLEVTDIGLAGILKPYAIDELDKDVYSFLAPEVVEPWRRKQGKSWYNKNKKVKLTTEEKTRNTTASDVWAAGVILYNMMCATMPFQGKDLVDLTDKIITNSKPPMMLSLEVQDILSSMLKKDPRQRTSFKQLLKNSWVRRARLLSEEPMGEDIVKHLGGLHAESQLKKMLMRTICKKVPAPRVHQLMKSFTTMDENGDGEITLKELTDGLGKFPHLFGSLTMEVGDIFKEIDHDKSGTISVDEFISATIETQQDVITAYLWDAFRKFDTDSSGTLSLEELQDLVQDLKGEMGDEHIQIMMHLLESQVPDTLTFEEFRQLMTHEESQQAAAAVIISGEPIFAKLRRNCRQVFKSTTRTSVKK